jgi:hypothetical protein
MPPPVAMAHHPKGELTQKGGKGTNDDDFIVL